MAQQDNKKIITLKTDKHFNVEITGPANAETAVMLIHGFGVKRDSRGLFTDIEDQISDKYLSVRGDFTEVYDGYSRAIPISSQVERLKLIVQHVQKSYLVKNIIYIGHSQGCLVVAKAAPTNSKIILLAPPIIDPAARFAKTPGWTRPGSILKMDGESRLQRSDGSITIVDSEFWSDFSQINAQSLYEQLNTHNDVQIIFAGSDQVLGNQEAPQGIKSNSIPLAEHDFKGESRKELLDKLLNIIH